MAAGGRDVLNDDEWDNVWQDYDRRNPLPDAPSAPSAPSRRPAQRRNLAVLLSLVLGLAFVPRLALLHDGTNPDDVDGQAGLVSLAPAEAEMPPLSTSIARLAAQSSNAACWVMQLDPRRPACP